MKAKLCKKGICWIRVSCVAFSISGAKVDSVERSALLALARRDQAVCQQFADNRNRSRKSRHLPEFIYFALDLQDFGEMAQWTGASIRNVSACS